MLIPIASAALPSTGNRAFGAQRETHIHNGIDLPAPAGTPVLAAAPGQVTHASDVWEPGFTGYGRHVVLAHPDRTFSLYAHLESVAVAPGQAIDEGELIGTVGNSLFSAAGGHSDESGGAHLHFEVSPRPYPQPSSLARLDPLPWLTGAGGRDRFPGSPSSSSSAEPGGSMAAVAIASLGGLWWLLRRRRR